MHTIPKPFNIQTTHLLNYLNPITNTKLKTSSQTTHNNQTKLQHTNQIKQTKLKKQYNTTLHNQPNITTININIHKQITNTLSQINPSTNNHLITNIDTKIQTTIEQTLHKNILTTQNQPNPNNQKQLKTNSNTTIIINIHTNQIITITS